MIGEPTGIDVGLRELPASAQGSTAQQQCALVRRGTQGVDNVIRGHIGISHMQQTGRDDLTAGAVQIEGQVHRDNRRTIDTGRDRRDVGAGDGTHAIGHRHRKIGGLGRANGKYILTRGEGNAV